MISRTTKCQDQFPNEPRHDRTAVRCTTVNNKLWLPKVSIFRFQHLYHTYAIKKVSTLLIFLQLERKRDGTYRRGLEGALVVVLWSNVVEETREPREHHGPYKGDHDPVTYRSQESNTGRRDNKWRIYPMLIRFLCLESYRPILIAFAFRKTMSRSQRLCWSPGLMYLPVHRYPHCFLLKQESLLL